MTPFDFITVVLSLILGLGVTHLLSSAVEIFRSRDLVKLNWIAHAWAAVILFWQLQFWWAIFELSKIIHVWTTYDFAALLALALLLFVAGALILPSAHQEAEQRTHGAFQRDGRWALVVLSVYFGTSLVCNWFLFNTSIFSFFGALVAALMVITLIFLLLRTHFLQMSAVVTYMVLSLWVASVISPTSY